MIVESAETITEGWMAGTEHLLSRGGDEFTCIVHVCRPAEPVGPELAARRVLDQLLGRRGLYDTQTVANSIFPQEMARNRTADELYARYLERTFARIRRIKPNRHGTYFHRLIYLGSRNSSGELVIRNPLQDVIAKMRGAMNGGMKVRSAYELAVYRPELDSKLGMGFPCLSHVSLKLDHARGCVHLTAIYRNQYYLQRAYGNFLGLARLQAFIARELSLAPGEFVCHATHAKLEAGRKVVQPVLDAMRGALAVGASSSGNGRGMNAGAPLAAL